MPPPDEREREGADGNPPAQLPNIPSSMGGRVCGCAMPRRDSIDMAAMAAAVIHGLMSGLR